MVVAASAPPVTKCVGTRHWAEVGTKYRLKLWLLIADARWRSNRPKQKSVGGLLSQQQQQQYVPISRATLEGWMPLCGISLQSGTLANVLSSISFKHPDRGLLHISVL